MFPNSLKEIKSSRPTKRSKMVATLQLVYFVRYGEAGHKRYFLVDNTNVTR